MGSAPKCEFVCDPLTHHFEDGSCVRNICEGPHENPNSFPTCTCLSGYEKQNGACVLKKPTLQLSAPTLARQGTAATISWSVQGLPADGLISCSIRSNPAGVFSRSYPLGTEGTAWQGSGQTAPGPS